MLGLLQNQKSCAGNFKVRLLRRGGGRYFLNFFAKSLFSAQILKILSSLLSLSLSIFPFLSFLFSALSYHLSLALSRSLSFSHIEKEYIGNHWYTTSTLSMYFFSMVHIEKECPQGVWTIYPPRNDPPKTCKRFTDRGMIFPKCVKDLPIPEWSPQRM